MSDEVCVVCGAYTPEGYGMLCSTCREKMKTEEPVKMTINEYQNLAMRTANNELSMTDALLNGLMGLNGEAGEAIDLMKKHLFQGHPLDSSHIAKELGDIAWYLAVSANAIGYPLEEIFKMNIEKLTERYPDGFDVQKSINRAYGDV